MRVMSIEEARYIVRWLDPGPLARKVWRAAGDEGYAVGALALSTHRVIVVSWPAAGKPHPIDEPLVALVFCEPGQHTRTHRRLSYAASVPPSEEVVEEEAVREAIREGICFERVEKRLREIYGESQVA